MPFDEDLQEQWEQRRRAHWNEENARASAEIDRKNNEWWTWYNAYLQTTEWRMRRQAVLTRDNYLCQGCRVRRATQVHHLTYDHVGNEFLFELVAICETCHTRLHDKQDN